MNTINITENSGCVEGGDCTRLVVKAIEEAPENSVILFSKATYNFYTEHTKKHFCAVSNNGHGEKNIVFPIINKKNLTIDGGGSEFLFHGDCFPFVCDFSSNITLKNFTVDYDRPFHTEGIVVNTGDGYYDVKIDRAQYPYRIEDGKLIFFSDYWQSDVNVPVLLTEYDEKTRAMAYGHGYYVKMMGKGGEHTGWEAKDCFTVQALSEETVRLFMQLDTLPYIGSIMTFLNEGRTTCGFFFNRSENIAIENVNLHHCSGMGVIAQMTKNIVMRGVSILPPPNGGRIVSIDSDATHFVNCTGSIDIHNCVFESMLDDACNIHGVYTIIEEMASKRELKVKYNHQRIDIYNVGDTVCFIERKTMKPRGYAKISAIEDIDRFYTHLFFVDDIPDGVVLLGALENVSNMPLKVYISGCRTGRNRPRGFLLTTSGEVLIENNVFYNADCAIEMAADANYWFESGPTENVTIRGNRFIDCGYSWGCPVIHICPVVPEGDFKFHKNVKITDNEFIGFNNSLIKASHVENLVSKNNTFRKTYTFPPFSEGEFVELNNAEGEIEEVKVV